MDLEHFGTPCKLTEPNIVGSCEACGGEIYDYELAECTSCGKEIHRDCEVRCITCDGQGCKGCLIKDSETLEYFCEECHKDIVTEASLKSE